MPPPQTPSEKGEALVRAAMSGALPSVQALLSSGASASHASTQNSSAMTALMWAAAEGHVAIARELLSAGASPNARNAAGVTPLVYAFENLPNDNPRPPPPPGFPGEPNRPTPPQMPVRRRVTGHAAVAKLLLASGADPKVRSTYGETLLHLAARKAQLAWVELCAGVGIGLDEASAGYLETAMHVAAKEGHEQVVRHLCEAGATVDARSRFGWTPLIWASACGNVAVVKALLEFGADPNAKSYAGEGVKETTALKEARRCSRPVEMSKLLVRAGAVE